MLIVDKITLLNLLCIYYVFFWFSLKSNLAKKLIPKHPSKFQKYFITWKFAYLYKSIVLAINKLKEVWFTSRI